MCLVASSVWLKMGYSPGVLRRSKLPLCVRRGMPCLHTAQHQGRFGKRPWRQQDSFQPKLSKCSQQEAMAALNSYSPHMAEKGSQGSSSTACFGDALVLSSAGNRDMRVAGTSSALAAQGHFLSPVTGTPPLTAPLGPCRALAPRGELPLLQHTPRSHYCAHCAYGRNTEGICSPFTLQGFSLMRYS